MSAPTKEQLDTVTRLVKEEGMTLAAAVRTLGRPGDPSIPSYATFHARIGHLVRRTPAPTLPRTAATLVGRLECAIELSDKLSSLVEHVDDPSLYVPLTAALRAAADTRRWLTDAIECVRIDNGLTASGEARIEKVTA